MLSRSRSLLLTLLGGLTITVGLLLSITPGATAPVAAAAPPSPQFVDESATFIPNGETVRVLCFTDSTAATLIADVEGIIAANGQLANPLTDDCLYLIAMHELHEQPSGKVNHGPAYWAYATSWELGDVQALSSTGTITLSTNNPLVLFNVVASLEWEPAPGSPFIDELYAGLHDASAYLYDITEGKMAFGPVKIYTDGENWNNADLRFRAGNDVRPAALVGGIVPALQTYITPKPEGTTYAPGEITLGRYWDGNDAYDGNNGSWAKDNAFRTLVHEWGHYGLFLYDEYQQGGGAPTYCTCNDLPDVGIVGGACGGVSPGLASSVMAFQYTASELWYNGLPASCSPTAQWTVHGQTDWETLGVWPDIQDLSGALPTNLLAISAPPQSGPNSLGFADYLFDREPGYTVFLPLIIKTGGAPVPSEQMIISLAVEDALTEDQLNGLQPEIYLLEEINTGLLYRDTYQGTTTGKRELGAGLGPHHLGQIELLGVQATDRARVSVKDYTNSTRYVYAPPAAADPPLSNGQTLLLTVDPWGTEIDFDFPLDSALLNQITVVMTSALTLGAEPVAQLCIPDATVGCPANAAYQRKMVPVGGQWQATFLAAELGLGDEIPHYGVVRITSPEFGERNNWFYTAGGVGPAHIDAHAPLIGGAARVHTTPGTIQGDINRVVISSVDSEAALQAFQDIPGSLGVEKIVGNPINIDIVTRAGFIPANTILTLYYSQDVINRNGLDENGLFLIHFDQAQGVWSRPDINNAVNPGLNSVSGLIVEDGIYAIVQ